MRRVCARVLTIFATTCSAAALALDNEMFLPRVTRNPEEGIT